MDNPTNDGSGTRGKTPGEQRDLRQRAEGKAGAAGVPGPEALGPDEARRVLHELQVHQIELEMQNDELRRTQEELEASRARYVDLYDFAPVGYVTVDAQGCILESNLTAAALFGAERRRLCGARLARFILPEDQDICYRHQKELFGKGTPQAYELRLMRVDGVPFWARLEAALSPNEDEADPVCRLVVSDITGRRRAEEEREKLQTQLRQRQRLEAVGTLAGGVAHEINNPINGAMNYAQLILDATEKGSPLREYAGEILRETERVAVIVRDLLQFARHEKQGSSPARVQEIVIETVTLIRTIVGRDRITILVELPDDLPMIDCRSQEIQQVLMNLLTNARDVLNARYPDYSDNKITRVIARAFDRDGAQWVRITVEDHGLGIAPEVREHIFDPFFTTKPRNEGTGLGLSVSHGIVKEHHGDLHFETEPGQGTRFHLDLPVDNGWELGEGS